MVNLKERLKASSVHLGISLCLAAFAALLVFTAWYPWPYGIRPEPWTGPTMLAVRPFRDAAEEGTMTMQALQGIQLAARPDLWQPWGAARDRVLAAAQSVESLERKLPTKAALIDAALQRTGRNARDTLYLPLVSRKLAWTAFLDPKTAQVVGFAPLDSF
jgi:hypothetical protein